MTATNHILTGALIGGLVTNPLVAIPLAFLSHYVLDALPHFGEKDDDRLINPHVLAGDIGLSIASLIWLAVTGQPNAWLLVACGIAGASPDLLWFPYFWAELRGKMKPFGWYSRIAKQLQWSERPWGMAVEVAWGFAMVILLIKLV